MQNSVAEAENALIAKATTDGITFAQYVSTAGAVATKNVESDRPKPDPAAMRAAMRDRDVAEIQRLMDAQRGPSLATEVLDLHKAVCGGQIEGTLVTEIHRTGEGYTVAHSREFTEISPARLVLDTGYRYPNNPAPGMPRPEGIEVTDRPTDPEVLSEVRALVAEFTERATALLGTAPELGEGSSEAELLAAETAIGLRLPEDLRALYRCVSDDLGESGLLGAQKLLPLDQVVAEYLTGDPGTAIEPDDLFPVYAAMLDSSPPNRIRRATRGDWWLIIAVDLGCNSCAIDLDPAPEGGRGQIFEFGRDFHCQAGYIADSVTAVLRQVVTTLRDHETAVDADDSLTLRHIGRSDLPRATTSERMNGRSVTEVVAAIADPGDTQQLYLNDGTTVDLSALAPLPNLREVSVNRAASVTGVLPARVPVESLSINGSTLGGGTADLTGLAGHPSLWYLEVTNARTSIAPLLEVPGLVHLNLAGSEADDLELVADLPELRVLTLDAAQWLQLREAGRIPGNLAAAGMEGRTELAEALEWRRSLAG